MVEFNHLFAVNDNEWRCVFTLDEFLPLFMPSNRRSIGDLLIEFLRFYEEQFRWSSRTYTQFDIYICVQ